MHQEGKKAFMRPIEKDIQMHHEINENKPEVFIHKKENMFCMDKDDFTKRHITEISLFLLEKSDN
jgi:hypothetical protein